MERLGYIDMTDLIQKFIPEVTHLIDRGDWYELFQAAYESGFKNNDFQEMIEMFMKADIYDDKAMQEREEFFIDYLKASLVNHTGRFPVLMSDLLIKILRDMFASYDYFEVRKLIIKALKSDLVPGFKLDTSLGTVKVDRA